MPNGENKQIRWQTRSEAAERLREHIPRILEQWEGMVRDSLPAAKHQEKSTLHNSLPQCLESITEALLRGEAKDDPKDTASAREHGKQRAELERYSLEQVIEEYYLLRETVLDELETDDSLEPEAEAIIRAEIDYGIKGAAAEYVRATREALEKRSRALEDADRRKNQFLAVLAHEFRTPLSILSNTLFILENSTLDGRQSHGVEIAARQTRHLSRLLEDLNDISRIAYGKVELRRETVSLTALAQAVAESVRPIFEARKQAFTVQLPKEPLFLEADPLRLEQVITNLLKNASKFTGEGGEIRLCVVREGEEAVLKVMDTGIGIEPTRLSSVFDIFVQVGAEPVHSNGGLGIGLALVKHLVELHGGEVAAYSEGLMQGSEFVARLPVKG